MKALADQIEDAKEILDYEFDWDDDQGMPTDIETFQNAINFVVDYSVRIFQTQNTILSTPYIDIMKDGAISVHWETEKGQLFIIFDRNETLTRNGLAYFYAVNKLDGIPFKSAIRLEDPVKKHIAEWMEENLS